MSCEREARAESASGRASCWWSRCAGLPSVLTKKWCRGTRSTDSVCCTQTAPASQITKHAARAHFLAPRLSANKAPGRMPTQPFFASLVACVGRRARWWGLGTDLERAALTVRLRLTGETHQGLLCGTAVLAEESNELRTAQPPIRQYFAPLTPLDRRVGTARRLKNVYGFRSQAPPQTARALTPNEGGQRVPGHPSAAGRLHSTVNIALRAHGVRRDQPPPSRTQSSGFKLDCSSVMRERTSWTAASGARSRW